MFKAVLKLTAATLVYAVVHSALASRRAKNAATRLLGERRRNALYRPFYIAQSVVTFAALGIYAHRLPDRVLYEVRGPARHLMNFARLLSLAYAVQSARQVGIQRMLGITSMRSYFDGDCLVPPEPEAQGPAISSEGEMRSTGPFRFSRHPLNFAPLPVLALKPRMTVRLAAFTAVSAAYFVVGSVHEEMRLRAEYGPAYERYESSGVPFYIPRPNDAASTLPAGSHVDSRRLGADSTESAA